MLYHKYKPLAARVYCTGLALLLVLSEVFSSNVQDTLPGFSRIMRLGLTGCAVLLLAGKIILLTGYEARWQKVLIAVVLVYTAFSSWYGGDLWFFLAALVGLGAKDVDWETALRVYLVTAVAGLVLVPVVSLFTRGPDRGLVERAFSCYDRRVTVRQREALGTTAVEP